MKRIILALVVGGALFGTVAFAAAALGLNAGNLSQGQDDVNDCAGGVTVNLHWDTGGANPVVVESVDVDAPDSCAGAQATVEIFDSGTGFRDAESCNLNANGNCNNLDIAPDLDVVYVDTARVTLSGP